LQKENVKTLPREIFDKVDTLAAPRLVEYWEQDPCFIPPDPVARGGVPRSMMAAKPSPEAASVESKVKIEAQFKVGEYEIVILSATDAAALDTWLKKNNYKIPEGAEPLLRPYVQAGSKFFVAKVDTSKVRFDDKGMAELSPLRFHYDAEQFNLPVRLGLINSAGTQDLIVHILAKGKRYELANYKNVTIPTNLDVDEKARDQFGALYAALFDRTIEKNPGAVVTEYAWDASSCDPCPGPTLNASDLATLGADVLPGAEEDGPTPQPPVAPGSRPGRPMPRPFWGGGGFTLTRLHARYGRNALGEDLVFRTADPITGGREWLSQGSKLETGATKARINNFQGRYAIRHPWKGPIACENPVRGRWGGPPAGEASKGVKAAQDLAFAPRGGFELASMVRHDVPEVDIKAAEKSASQAPRVAHAGATSNEPAPAAPTASPTPTASSAPTRPATETAPPAPEAKGCGACAVGEGQGSAAAALATAFGAALSRLRRKRR
jgi:hypothetical protein